MIKQLSLEDIYGNVMFDAYYDLLIEWNQKFNLTSITDKGEVYIKHFLDSTAAYGIIPENAKVLDIGCGGGFPSIPLKIVRKDLNFTLIDSVGKKIRFVKEVINILTLTGINASHTRIEEFRENNFDVVVARAVAPLNTLLEYSLPFLKIGGNAIFYKSADADEEIINSENALKVLGGKIKEVNKFYLTGTDILRSLVTVSKTKPSPKGYPRALNKPRKNPL